MPQGHVETADPKTLHLSGEFIESNLGTAIGADGMVTVRLIAQQYSFQPQCLVVPVDTPVSLPCHQHRCRSTDSSSAGRTPTPCWYPWLRLDPSPRASPGSRRAVDALPRVLRLATKRCGRGFRCCRPQRLRREGGDRRKAQLCSRLAIFSVLAHFWVAFIAFFPPLERDSLRQMYIRSPLSSWINNPEHYYRSVTAHGTVMGYVFPTLIAMGFGYAITELALKRPLIGLRWAWAGFWLLLSGAAMAAIPTVRPRRRVGALHLRPTHDRRARSTTSVLSWWWSDRGSGSR